MNIERFGLPVIIAAGLHGTLFLFSREAGTRSADPAPRTVAIILPPLPELPFNMEPEPQVTDPDPGGPVSQCHLEPVRLPETGLEARPDAFTVPLQVSLPATEKVTRLEGVTGLPTGPGGVTGGTGISRLPGTEELDRVPRARAQPPPAYPLSARREGIGGSVLVEFVVGPSGEVVRAEAVRWSRRDFVDPALRAVMRWRFEPGTIDGRKVTFRLAVPIEFTPAP